ncbi:MAG: EAL domain-containing protein [Actinomycetota bacterium]
MTDIGQQRDTASDATRREALARLAGLADPATDDLTRELQMRVSLGALDGPAMLVDLDGTVLDTNDHVAELGLRRQLLRGRMIWASDAWSQPDTASVLPPLVERAAGGHAGTRAVETGGADPHPVRVALTPLLDTDGAPTLLLAELHRLADRGETEAMMAETTERLAAAEDIFRAVAEYTSDLVCLHEPDGTYTYVSPSARRLLDVDPASLVGTHPVDHAHPATREALVNGLQDAARRGAEPTRFRHRVRHRNGGYRWFETAITPIRDGSDDVRQLQSSSRDITEQRETEQSLIKKAFHDELTGLANKALLLDRMTQAFAISRRTGQTTGVLFIDLDGFKTVNDTLGHHVGDTALTKVAERLTAIVRPGDTLARIGGDEFVILCPGTDGARGASTVARRVLNAIKKPFVLDGQEVGLGCSIGIATTDGTDAPDAVLDRADTAMYEAKHGGKGRYAIHDLAEQSIEVHRNDVEAALRHAIEHDELRLHYQPELDLETGRIVGFEALVRWQGPDGRLVPPAEFIPLAEETGIIVELGRWVIAEACRQASRWRVHRTPDQEPIRIWVNLSARQLGDPELVGFVEEAVAAAGITTDEICMEITESALMGDAESATEQLDQLRRLGISLGIDDFGTGWSQFEYLNRLPLDVLKIDRYFVHGLGVDKNAAVIVNAIIELAHALGLIVIAEGVETREQLEVLEELDCDQALGFYFSEPREAAAFEQALTGR